MTLNPIHCLAVYGPAIFLFSLAAALGEVASLFRSEKVRAWRRHHAKFAQKFRERIAKLPAFRHAARSKKSMPSLKLSAGSVVRSGPKKQARGAEITQILCENLAKELQQWTPK